MAFTDNAAATAQRHADASKSAAAAQPASGMLRVILTGGTKGVGRALARELLWSGDRVLITGRSQASVDEAVTTLRAQTGCATDAVVGFAADTCHPAAVVALAQAAPALLGGPVDSWIVNAGKSGGYQSLADASPAALQEVVNTTLFGALLCAQAAQRLFSDQRNGGTLWLTDGAGGAGDSTPQLVAYGACKAALRQAARSIAAEARKASEPPAFAVGMLSPGMCLTDLLLEGASPQSKRAFNALADHPETAAAELVPMLRRAHAAAVAQRASSAPHLRVLTPPRAALRLAALPLSRNRFFDAAGQPTYAPERERIAKLVARKARERYQLEAGAAAWRKRRTVALAYATCALALLGTYVALG
jgi:chlorophyll(ide) b reductase